MGVAFPSTCILVRFQTMRFVSLIMLPIWGVLALLGHSGTHALADWLGVCCHLETVSAELESGEIESGQTHRGCVHCARSRGAAAEPLDSQPAPSSSHDAENCRLCDWFLCWNAQAPSACQSPLVDSWVPVKPVPEVVSVDSRSIPAASRSPPLA